MNRNPSSEIYETVRRQKAAAEARQAQIEQKQKRRLAVGKWLADNVVAIIALIRS